MTDTQDTADVARDAAHAFLKGMTQLTRADVDRLAATSRSARRTSLDVDASFLNAVASGAWGPEHTEMAREIREAAREQARTLPWHRRSRVAQALADAALVVLSNEDPRHPLPEDLCRRLAAPWETATGVEIVRPRRAIEDQ